MPAENTGDFPAGSEAIPFTVQGPPAVDNGRMTVHIEWTNPDTDWDIYITDSTGEVVTQSASFGDTNEDATLVDPPPGQYTAHVQNYDQVDGQPVDDWSAAWSASATRHRARSGAQGGVDPHLRGSRGPPARHPPRGRGSRPACGRGQRVLAQLRCKAHRLTEERKNRWAGAPQGASAAGAVSR